MYTYGMIVSFQQIVTYGHGTNQNQNEIGAMEGDHFNVRQFHQQKNNSEIEFKRSFLNRNDDFCREINKAKIRIFFVGHLALSFLQFLYAKKMWKSRTDYEPNVNRRQQRFQNQFRNVGKVFQIVGKVPHRNPR